MSSKPQAILSSDEDCIFTRFCKTKEQAFELMKKQIIDEELEDVEISIDDVQEDYYWKCRRRGCDGYMTIGDSTCIECGENLSGRGWKTFYINF